MSKTFRVVATHRHSVARLTFRYLAGRDLDGQLRCDASFIHPATRILTRTGRASRWSQMPGYQRSLWRLGVPLALAATLDAELHAPVTTEATAGTLAASAAAYGSLRAVRAVKLRRHTARYVRPLAAVLAAQMGLPPNTPPAKLVTVPLNFQNPRYDRDAREANGLPNGTVRVVLPPTMADTPEAQRAVQRTVLAKLGLAASDMDATFHWVGAEPYATFRRAPRPPDRITFAKAVPIMEAARPDAPVIGLGARDVPIVWDMAALSPHLLISASTGAGKSSTARAVLAQCLRAGHQLVVLDIKRQSLRAMDLPGVTYLRDIADIHDQLIALAAEGERRNRLTDAIPADVDTDDLDVGPRIIIALEEINGTAGRLADYWSTIRTSKDSKTSPAVRALAEILFLGRASKLNCLVMGQLLTARSLGGPELRECFSTRVLSRYSVNAARMLAPEVWPFPKSSRRPGRCQVVYDGAAHECQALYLTDAEAREWSQSGALTVPVAWTQTGGRGLGEPSGQGQPEPRYTLAEAARQPWCRLSYEALKKARQRSAEWPEGQRRAGRERWTEAQLRAALGADVDQDATAPAA